MVVLTSLPEEQAWMPSCDLGVNSYVRKPVDFNQFAEAAGQIGLFWMLLNETLQARRP